MSKNIKDYIKDNKLNIEKILEDYSPYIKKIINNMVNENLSSEDKEEILIDTIFVLWKNRDFDILSLDSYIAGITKNLVKEKLRRRLITYSISDYENSIEISKIDTYYDERNEIEDALNILTPIDQDVFRLYYYNQKSVKEISKALDISEFNVTTKLYRARKKLRKILKSGGDINE